MLSLSMKLSNSGIDNRTLIVQSCEMAAFVYQNYLIEKKSTEDIVKEFNADEESTQLVTQYYDINKDS